MDLCNKHFIQTSRGGLAIKVPNIDSLLRPALAFKTLNEVYECEDAKRSRFTCIINSHNMAVGSVFDSDLEKSEIPCLSMADRSLHEIKPKTDEFVPCSDNDPGSDLDDDTTLKQLKERCKAKKRKFSCSGMHSSQADANGEPVKDDSDLNEPLIRLKSKLSKNSKTKRKFTSGSFVMSSTNAFAVKSEQNLVSKGSLQVGGELAPVIHVKVEAPDAEQLGCQSTTSFADDSSIGHNRGSNSCGVASNEFQKMLQCKNTEPLSLTEEYQSCVTNEISYDHLEDIELTNVLVPFDVKVENLELSCPEFLVLPPSSIEKGKEIRGQLSCSEYQNSDMCSNSSMEEILDQSNIPGIQVSDMATDDNVGCMGCNHDINFNQLEDRAETEFPYKQDDSLISQESSPENKAYDCADTHSTPKLHQHPERLLSTRKAISPSSQEQLRLAMDSVELCNDAKKFIDSESKGKLFEKQTGQKATSVDIQYHAGPGQVSHRKVIPSPREIIKKSKNAQGNLEGPHYSRSLPNLSTGCTSIKGCSESAIAFSQRQMHDMESLAGKLMNELKSMKQKLLFEAYHNISLKNDADEVKLAIDNTKKVEETARKWLNMMSRDCNRFCKIMKLTSNGIATSKDAGPKERKKIKFADEAGGELCHVKFFEDTPTSPVSDSVKQ